MSPVKKLFSTSNWLLNRQQSSILSAAAVITVSNLFSAFLGLMRNRMLLSRFFSTPELQQQLDAYWVAFRLPELAFQLLVIGALSAAFIPVYSQYRKKSLKEANLIATSMLNLVFLVFLVLSIIIFIFAEPLTAAFTSVNFTQEQLDLAVQLTRIMLVAQLFFAISNFLTGIIQAHQRFLIPALAPLAYNLGIILGTVLLSDRIGIYAPAVGVVIGAMLHLVLQLPSAIKLGFRYQPIINLKHPGVRSMIRLMPPRALTIAVNQLELFASVFFTTALPVGSLTIFNIAQQLLTAPIRIFSVPIGQASLPFLSDDAADGQLDRFKETFISAFNQVLFLAFPASVLLLVLRIPLVRLTYGSAEFPWTATLLTGRTVAALSISLFALGGLQVVNRAFYALHNTRTPFFVALISAGIYVGFSSIAVFLLDWEVVGLSLVMSFASVFQFVVLLWLLLKRIGNISVIAVVKPAIKMFLAASIMGICLWVPMRLLDQVLDTTRVLPLVLLTVLASGIGGLVYLGLAKILRIPELNMFMQLLKKLGNWRSVLTKSEEVLENTSQTQEIKPL